MTSPRRLFAAVAVVLLAMPAVAGCTAGGPFAVKATGSEALEVAVPAGVAAPRVQVEMFNGSIEVRPGRADRIAATVRTTGVGGSKADAEADRAKIVITLVAQPDGSALLRAVYQPDPGSPDDRAASAVVEVPPGSALDLRTSNGEVTTTGIGGTIEVRTSNGAVNLAGAAAGATVRTSNEHVEVDGGGLLDLQTSNAAVVIRGLRAVVRARTSNGSIGFDGSLADGAQSMETSNEGIVVRLPAGAGFTVDAATSNAEVRLDGFTIRRTAEGDDGELVGSVGAGGPSLRLRTSNAAIVVQAR